MEKLWRNKFLILGIFSLLIGSFAKANLRDQYVEQKSLDKTICNWNNAQYDHSVFPNVSRFCIDYENKTIFLVKEDPLWGPFRKKGFLNKGENVKEEYGYSIKQWNVEGDYLVEYSCVTYSLSSNSCDGEVSSYARGNVREKYKIKLNKFYSF